MSIVAARSSLEPGSIGSSKRPVRRSVVLGCQAVRERDFKQIARRIVDLSDDGMLVSADVPVLTGESVIVTFQTALAKAWVDVEGVVVRVLHGRRRGDTGLRLGLLFQHVDVVSRARLSSELGWFRAVLPTPRQAG